MNSFTGNGLRTNKRILQQTFLILISDYKIQNKRRQSLRNCSTGSWQKWHLGLSVNALATIIFYQSQSLTWSWTEKVYCTASYGSCFILAASENTVEFTALTVLVLRFLCHMVLCSLLETYTALWACSSNNLFKVYSNSY